MKLEKTMGTARCPWPKVVDNRKWYKPWTWRKRYPNYYFADGITGEVIDMERLIRDTKKAILADRWYAWGGNYAPDKDM